jgi:hypothetical protein
VLDIIERRAMLTLAFMKLLTYLPRFFLYSF